MAHKKAPVEIAAGSFMHMKEDVTGASHTHGWEPPSNWATTCMHIKFMTKEYKNMIYEEAEEQNGKMTMSKML